MIYQRYLSLSKLFSSVPIEPLDEGCLTNVYAGFENDRNLSPLIILCWAFWFFCRHFYSNDFNLFQVKFWIKELSKTEPDCSIYICATKTDLIKAINQYKLLNYHSVFHHQKTYNIKLFIFQNKKNIFKVHSDKVLWALSYILGAFFVNNIK